MDVNASIVREARLARSWTQQHLADTCNLSLRTIQRVERFGSAAPDTVMELCAVLEIAQDQLVRPPQNGRNGRAAASPLVLAAIAAATLFGAALGAMAMYIILQ